MEFIEFMRKHELSYRDRRGIAPYTNGERTMSVSKIAIHHSGADVDQTSELLEDYWRTAHGWTTGGYHLIIRRDASATIEWNYDYDRVSNGVGNHNGYILNICVEGNSNFTPRQNEVVKLVTRFWKDNLGLPYTSILGHNEFSGHATNTCPGRNMSDFRDQINNMPAAHLIPVSQPSSPVERTSDVVIPYRRPVSYNATVTSAGFSIDSRPWGEEGFSNWGITDNILGNSVYIYEENFSGEYVNAYKVGWIDKRSISKEKVVFASTLFLPDGNNWTVYNEGDDYKVGTVISTEAPGEDPGLYLTVLGDKGNNILIVNLPNLGNKAIYFDYDKGARVTKVYA